MVNSEASTLVESDLGTLVINEDSEDDSTMKRKLLYQFKSEIEVRIFDRETYFKSKTHVFTGIFKLCIACKFIKIKSNE